MEVWIVLLALAWTFGFLRGRYRPGTVIVASRPVLICMLVWLAFVWLQLVPLPIGLLELISPQSSHWHIAAAFPDAISSAPLTLDRYSTLEAALKSTVYIIFFALGLILLDNRERLRIATYVLIASGTVQALYGAALSFQHQGEQASGTFVNRNHFAAYLVMCLSVGVGVLIASLSGAKHHSWGQFFRGIMQWIITPKMGLRLLLVTMVIALVLTRSRMGNFSFFVGLFSIGMIALAVSKTALRSMIVVIASLVLIDLFIVGAYFGTQRVVESIGQTTLQSEDRDEVAGYAIRMWKDYPVFGAGLGSFAAVFPRYSGEGTVQSYTHAHNDYLEFAAETGVAGIVLLGLMVSMSFLAALRTQLTRTDPILRGASFASMMGTIALAIHSSVDFNLQIPANALMFILLLAFGWASRYAAGRETDSGPDADGPRHRRQPGA